MTALIQIIPFVMLLVGLIETLSGAFNLISINKKTVNLWEKAKLKAQRKNQAFKTDYKKIKKRLMFKFGIQFILGVVFLIALLPQIRIGVLQNNELQLIYSKGQNGENYIKKTKEIVDTSQYPGVAICIVDGDESYILASGIADFTKKNSVDESTIFEIGSITKAFTGMMLSQSISQNQIAIDDTAASVLHDSGLDNSVFGAITMKELTTHTSGLPRNPNSITFFANNFLSGFIGGNPYNIATEDRIKKLMKNTAIDADKPWVYSNYGVGVLGMCIAKANNKSYEELLQQFITSPLDMNSTSTLYNEDKTDLYAEGFRSYFKFKNLYIGIKNQPWEIEKGLVAAGGIKSNAKDMLNLLATLTDEKSDFMHRAMQPIKPLDEKRFIGMNWVIDAMDNGKDMIWHNGQTGGFNSFIGIVKGQNKGVYIVSNSVISVQPLAVELLQYGVE